MQNVRNRIMSIETKCFGIKFCVLENVLWRIGKKRQSQTQIACFHPISRNDPFLVHGLVRSIQPAGIHFLRKQNKNLRRICQVWDALLSRNLPIFYQKSDHFHSKSIQNNVFLCTTELSTCQER